MVPLVLYSFGGFSQSGNSVSSTQHAVTDPRQLIHVHGRTFTDTAWSSSYSPDSIFTYYYSLRSKYPESSETIRQYAVDFLSASGQRFAGSGYMTFRFFIDTAGRMAKRIEVLQTDEFYKEYNFDEKLVWALFDFLQTMHEWKAAKAPNGFPPFYINIITFKIHEGSVVNVIP